MSPLRAALSFHTRGAHRLVPSTRLGCPAQRRLALGVLLLGLFAFQPLSAQPLTAVVPESVGVSSDRLERIDAALQDYVEDGLLPGAALIVARRGGIVYEKAFGYRDREQGDVLAPSDLFRIASQTKAIVSVGVMILQERGDLLIDHPLSRYIPAFENTTVAIAEDDDSYDVVPAQREITLRDLLTHTAGVDYGGGPAAERWEKAGIQGWYFAHREEPIRETVERMAELPMAAQPGERFVYGYSTDILGVVIEEVSGRPLNEFLETEIFEPLGMDDTHFYTPADKEDRLAVVYSRTENGKLERAPDPGHMVGQGMYVDGPRTSFSGGAGLLSTPADYLRFLEMLRRGGELNGHRILAPSTVQLMTTDHVHDISPWEGDGFGLGFQVTEELGHDGLPGAVGMYRWGGAYHSTYWVDPTNELVVAYMTQLIPASGVDDHGRIQGLVYQALVD